jgi:hypothetical protein
MDYDQVLKLMTELQESRKLRQVFWYSEYGVYMTGRLRSELGIRGTQEPVAKAVRNKFIMKEILRAHGINTSCARYAKNADSAVSFADDFGWPIVAKPVDGAASVFVKVLHDTEEVKAYFAEFNISDSVLKKLANNQVLVESFSNGHEYIVDSIIVGDKVVFSNVAKYFDNCVDAVAKGVLMVNLLPLEKGLTQDLAEFNKKVVSALGLTNTVTHAEYFVNELTGAIKFGEIAARCGGSEIYPEAINFCHGIDFAELAFDTLMENVGKIEPYTYKPTAVLLLPKKKGLLKRVATLEDLEKVADVVDYRLYVKPGDILGLMNSTVVSVGTLIITSPTVESLYTDTLKVYDRFIELMVFEA